MGRKRDGVVGSHAIAPRVVIVTAAVTGACCCCARCQYSVIVAAAAVMAGTLAAVVSHTRTYSTSDGALFATVVIYAAPTLSNNTISLKPPLPSCTNIAHIVDENHLMGCKVPLPVGMAPRKELQQMGILCVVGTVPSAGKMPK